MGGFSNKKFKFFVIDLSYIYKVSDKVPIAWIFDLTTTCDSRLLSVGESIVSKQISVLYCEFVYSSKYLHIQTSFMSVSTLWIVARCAFANIHLVIMQSQGSGCSISSVSISVISMLYCLWFS